MVRVRGGVIKCTPSSCQRRPRARHWGGVGRNNGRVRAAPTRTDACASSPRVTGPLTGAASGIPGCAAPNQPDVSIGCVQTRDATRTPAPSPERTLGALHNPGATGARDTP